MPHPDSQPLPRQAPGPGARSGELPVPRFLQRSNAYLEGLSRSAIRVICAALLVLTGAIDLATGPQLAFSIFYLFPVAIAAWHLGWRSALVMVGASGVTWLLADQLAGNVYNVGLVQYWNAVVRMSFFLVVAFTMTLLKQALRHERELARTDGLTGMSNRHAFDELADREIIRARRTGQSLSMAYLDIDNFKTVNDTLGHASGDALLRTVADTINAEVRDIDIVARLGGDEFAILLPDTHAEGADKVVNRILNALRLRAAAGGWPVDFSVGVVSFARAPASLHDMIHSADTLMYEVKRDGGGARFLAA